MEGVLVHNNRGILHPRVHQDVRDVNVCHMHIRDVDTPRPVGSMTVKDLSGGQRDPGNELRTLDPGDSARIPDDCHLNRGNPDPADLGIGPPATVMIRRPSPRLIRDPDILAPPPDPPSLLERRPSRLDDGGPDISVFGNRHPAAIGTELWGGDGQLCRQIRGARRLGELDIAKVVPSVEVILQDARIQVRKTVATHAKRLATADFGDAARRIHDDLPGVDRHLERAVRKEIGAEPRCGVGPQ
jgi:hypothetical protein